MNNQFKIIFLAIYLIVFGNLKVLADEDDNFIVSHWNEEEESGAVRWFLESSTGFKFEIVQRHPDQSVAFYTARGFSENIIKHYANTCIFHTSLFNNSDDKNFDIDLMEWGILKKNDSETQIRLLSTDYWLDQWNKYNVSKPAQIAFKFSQLPTVQHPSSGDWFQGMISMPLSQSDAFNLEIVWQEDDVKRQVVLENLHCNTSNVEP